MCTHLVLDVGCFESKVYEDADAEEEGDEEEYTAEVDDDDEEYEVEKDDDEDWSLGKRFKGAWGGGCVGVDGVGGGRCCV